MNRTPRPLQMLAKPREQVARVVGPRARLRVILNAEDRLALDGEPLVRVIEQVLVRDVHARRQRCRIDDEAVVLRRDLDLAGGLVEHRVIATMVPERQLQGLAPEREAQDLVTEADAEHRLAARAQLARGEDSVVDRRGIPGAIREKEPIRCERDGVTRRRLRGHDRDPRAEVAELAKDVLLDAEVIRDDVKLDRRDRQRAPVVCGAPRRLRPLVARGARDAGDEILAVHLRCRTHPLEHRWDRIHVRRDRAAHRAFVAQAARQ